MPKCARVGTSTDHVATLVGGRPFCFCGGERMCVRDLDQVETHVFNGARHVQNPIAEGSSVTFIDRRGVARVGDHTACGAMIVEAGTCGNTFSD